MDVNSNPTSMQPMSNGQCILSLLYSSQSRSISFNHRREESMNCKVYAISAALLFNANVHAERANWHIEKPYNANPLITATIIGQGQTRNIHGKVSLTLSCRGDAPPAHVTFSVDETLSEHFPTEIFEGPNATGEKAKLLSVRLGGEKIAQAWNTAGSFNVEKGFQWFFTPTENDLKRWLQAPGESLKVLVVAPGKNKQQLSANFILPEDATLLRKVLSPCVKLS